jgi:hypothetical protein
MLEAVMALTLEDDWLHVPTVVVTDGVRATREPERSVAIREGERPVLRIDVHAPSSSPGVPPGGWERFAIDAASGALAVASESR